MEELLQFIANYGFPAVMCVYMVVTNTKIVGENTKAVDRMNALLERLVDHLGGAAE